MYATYAVFSRLFCNTIKKSITKNENVKSVETTKKIKNLMQVSKFFKIFTTSGDGVLSFLSGAGIAVILTGAFLLELFAFGIALKVALVVASVLLCVCLASGIFGVVSLIVSLTSGKKKKAVDDKNKKIYEEMKEKIEEILVSKMDYLSQGLSQQFKNTSNIEPFVDIKENIKEILENKIIKDQNGKNIAARIIVEWNIERLKEIFESCNGGSEWTPDLKTDIKLHLTYKCLSLQLRVLDPKDKFYEEVLKDISIEDETYEKVLQFYFDELFSFGKNEKVNQYKVACHNDVENDAFAIYSKISDKKRREFWEKKMNEKIGEFKNDERVKGKINAGYESDSSEEGEDYYNEDNDVKQILSYYNDVEEVLSDDEIVFQEMYGEQEQTNSDSKYTI
jgi:hypothetical protein